MAKTKEEKTILKKGQAQFQLIGEAKVNDYTFKIDEESSSGWVYNVMNLGVDCGNGNVVYADMMGGYSNKGDSVDWEDRLDENITEQVGNQCFITVGLEKDAKDKTFSKKFLSSYDAIEYIKEHLTDGTVKM